MPEQELLGQRERAVEAPAHRREVARHRLIAGGSAGSSPVGAGHQDGNRRRVMDGSIRPSSLIPRPSSRMALKATICKASLQIADTDRDYYASHALTIARHPSETDERMMMRLLA